jgi:hypothetical protein
MGKSFGVDFWFLNCYDHDSECYSYQQRVKKLKECEKLKEYNSGKKKSNTIKSMVIVLCLVKDIIYVEAGKSEGNGNINLFSFNTTKIPSKTKINWR